MKQKTMHVESWPSDESDGEAVSPSSTKNFVLKSAILAVFLVCSINNSAALEETTNLTDLNYKIY